MPIIFISHGTADKLIVDDFYDLLQMGCNLRREEIFCSSVDGAGIKTGQDFTDWIRDNLTGSELVILFLTENYYSSRFCVAEMGAAWALGKDVFPLVIPGIERDPGSVMLGRQTAIIDESGLDELRDRIAKYYPPASEATSRWSLKKEEFLKRFREKISQLPKPPLINRQLLEEEKGRTTEAMKMNEQLTNEIRLFDEKIKLLEKAKDAEEVEKIKAKFRNGDARYKGFIEEVRKQLGKLTRPEIRSIYASTIGDSWLPNGETWGDWGRDIERALQSKWIKEPGRGENRYEANRDHPRMRPVFKSLKELDDFIKGLPPEAIIEMEEEKKYYVDIKNRQYWEEELVQNVLID